MSGAESALQRRELPGDLAMWFFILAELAVFALLFLGLMATRVRLPELFAQGQPHLHPWAGTANTMALLTGSLFVARGVEAVARGAVTLARRALAAGIACGGVYLAVKGWEYAVLLEAGFNLRTDAFWMFYFFATFFHLMHVVLGMVILAVAIAHCARVAGDPEQQSGMESAGTYWHMVDLVWLLIFPLFYVLP